MAVLDFSSVSAREPLAEGVYLMMVEEAEMKTARSGNEMLSVRYREIESGTAVFDNFVLTPQAMWKLADLITAVGLSTDELQGGDPADLIPMIKGAQLKVKVTQEEYDGKIQNRAKGLYVI